MRNVVQHEDGPSESVFSVVAVVRLQVDGEEGGVPIVGDKHQIIISKGSSPTWHHPRRLQRCFTQHSTAELNVLSISSVNVVTKGHEGGVVDEDVINAVFIGVEKAYFVVLIEHSDAVTYTCLPGVVVLCVARGDGHHTVAPGSQRLWESSHDVA